MDKRFDREKTYALALGGGGAKGGYEIGAVKALIEEGLVYNAVSGTSVGALNGALLAMRDIEKAEELWRNIRYSQVIDVDDDEMSRVFDKDLTAHELRPLLKRAIGIVKDGGFDVTPLRTLLKQYVDPYRIKSSDVDFVAVTYSLTDKKEVVADVRSLPEDNICDMLLASAYYPAFKNEPLVGGKRFTDGGVADVLPITPLLNRGYRNIIAIKLSGGLGRERFIRPRKDLDLTYIVPKRRLGSTMNFSKDQAAFNLSLGYYDAKRMVLGLTGEYYYLERTLTERQAYRELMDLIAVETRSEDETVPLRAVHESIIPRLAKEHGADGDYYDVLIRYLEHTGEVFKIPEFRIIKDTVLLSEVKDELKKRGVSTIAPKAFKS